MMIYNNDSRMKRIKVFEDTINICKTLKNTISESRNGQKFIADGDFIENVEENHKKTAEIVVSSKRTLESAKFYAKSGKKVCILNFASATNPGGGVMRGSNAQEECICRCSTLYPCLTDSKNIASFYSMHKILLKNGEMTSLYNDDIIFTPNVCVIKSDTDFPKTLPENERYYVDVITCAAPNLRKKPSNIMNPDAGNTAVKINNNDLKKLHIKRVNKILDVAKANNTDVVILGAFGCGAFQNPPEIVAMAMKKATEEHINDFETIEFAVYCTPNKMDNFRIFKKILS